MTLTMPLSEVIHHPLPQEVCVPNTKFLSSPIPDTQIASQNLEWVMILTKPAHWLDSIYHGQISTKVGMPTFTQCKGIWGKV